MSIILTCEKCKEIYNNDNFSRCPFCLTEHKKVEPKPEKEKTQKETRPTKPKAKRFSFIDDQSRIRNQKGLSITEKNFLLGNGVTTVYDIANMPKEKRKQIFSRISERGVLCLIDGIEKHRRYNKNLAQKNTLKKDKDIKIIDIPELSVRARNTLMRNGIECLSDLTKILEFDKEAINLLELKSVGKKTIVEIENMYALYQKKNSLDGDTSKKEDKSKNPKCNQEPRDVKIIYIPELSVRATNVLLRNGIESLSDLAKIIEFDKEAGKLFEFRNAGKKTIAEILEIYCLYKEKNFIAENESKKEYTGNDFALIEDVYKNHPDFIEKCKKKYIIYINNLINVSFVDFLKDFEAAQAIKIKEIFDRQLPAGKSYLFSYIDESYNNVNIDILINVGFPKAAVMGLSSSGIKTIGQLQLIEVNQMYTFQSVYKNMEKRQELEEKLKKDFRKNFQWFFNLQKISDGYEILIKRSNGATLEEIGKEYNVTKERIRQKERSSSFFVTRVVEEFLNSFFGSEDFVKESEIKGHVPDPQVYKIIEFLYKKKDNAFSYIDFAGIFVCSKDKDNMLKTLQSVVFSIVDEEIDIEEEFEEIDELLKENGIEFMEPENILAYWIVNTFPDN